MAKINKIQSGAAVISSSGTTVTVTLGSSIDSAKSFLWFSVYGDDGGAESSGRMAVDGYITPSTSQVVFTRSSSGGSDVTIKWYVVEFTSGVSVIRGVASNVNASTADISLGSTVSLSNSWAQCSTRNGYGWDYGGRAMVSASLPDTTHIRLRAVTDSSAASTTHWEVVTYDTAVVQNLYTGIWAGGGPVSGAISLSSSVSTSETFIVGNQYNSDSGYGGQPYEGNWWLSSTAINWRRNSTYQNRTYYLQVISIPGEILVQRNRATFTTAQTSVSQTFGSALSDATKAVIHNTTANQSFVYPHGNDSGSGIGMAACSIASSSSAQFNRQTAGGTDSVDVEWESIEFLSGGTIVDDHDINRAFNRNLSRQIVL